MGEFIKREDGNGGFCRGTSLKYSLLYILLERRNIFLVGSVVMRNKSVTGTILCFWCNSNGLQMQTSIHQKSKD